MVQGSRQKQNQKLVVTHCLQVTLSNWSQEAHDEQLRDHNTEAKFRYRSKEVQNWRELKVNCVNDSETQRGFLS